ncbi:MAG: type II toxin-antitoxin system VapC family toxin [Acidobacteriota bacterium]
MIVVDSNILGYAVIAGEFTNQSLRARRRDPAWVAPPLWRFEVRNILATTMRVEGLALETAADAFDEARDMVQEVEHGLPSRQVLLLAQTLKISAYDAEFVTLAEKLDLPLVTADRRLAGVHPERVLTLEEFAADPGI